MIPGIACDWKLLLKFVGGGLGLAGVLFICFRLYEHADEIDLGRFELTDWILLSGFCVTYGLANLLLARAWWCQLRFLGVKYEWAGAAHIYGVSQLAKYVPGNVFQIAGRQALGMAAGLPALPLVKSAVWELVLIASVAATYGILALPLMSHSFSSWASVFVFLLLLSTMYGGSVRWLGQDIGFAVLWYAVFLMLSGMIFLGVLTVVVGYDFPPSLIPALCGAYVLAWLAGLVTPGAPAGVGVREAVMMLALAPLFDSPDIVLAVVLGRMVTIAGDVLFFAGCSAVRNRAYQQT